MTNRSLDLSNKLSDNVIEGLRVVKDVADRLNIPMLLVGATAREIVLRHGYNIPGPAKRDIDFGVSVDKWEEFEELKLAIILTGAFCSNPQVPHRLESQKYEIRIDIIPFGKIESPAGMIVWEDDRTMTVSGFTEVHQNALLVSLADDLIVDVASPAGLALIKLVSWQERKANRDAHDFWLVASNYLDLGNFDRLFDEMQGFFDDDDFDIKLAGSALLARDVRAMLNGQTGNIIEGIFEDGATIEKIAIAIHGETRRIDESNFQKISDVLFAFRNELANQK